MLNFGGVVSSPKLLHEQETQSAFCNVVALFRLCSRFREAKIPMEFHDQMWSNDNFNHCNTKVTNIKSASTFLLACFGVICSHHFGLSVKPFKTGVPRFPVVSTTETAMVFVTVSAGYTAAAALAGVATIAELSRAGRSVLAPRYFVVRVFVFLGEGFWKNIPQVKHKQLLKRQDWSECV